MCPIMADSAIQRQYTLSNIREDYVEAPEDEAPLDSVEQELLPITRKRQIIVLFSSFMTAFQTIGINQSYGVFQGYYIASNGGPDAVITAKQAQNKALVAFVGTLGAGLTWAGSIFVNPLMARSKDLRQITLTGAALMSLGYGLAGSCSQIWQLILCQGFLYGIGSSMLYFPILSVAPEYFDSRRGAAMGFILSGAGVGGLVMAPVIRVLLDHIGIRWTLRALCFINLAIALPIGLSASPSRSSRQRPSLVNISLAKKPAFTLQALAALLQASGNFVPLNFLPEFSTALGYTAGFGAALLALSNGVNTASRIAMGFTADKAGRQNTLVLSVLGSAVSVFAFWMSSLDGSKALWITFVVAYGILAGGYNALFPTTITEVFGIQAYASVNGFIYFVRGLGAFFGTPVGGIIMGSHGSNSSVITLKDYRKLIWYDGALLLGSSLCVMAVRGFDAYEKKHWRWKA
ncbi:major facilitator superfamily protein [Xylona heveae TC161]|uniref:Major facilitator superfamily protein n=1 Tax=Xylona heveae (strain CBS 132557 / TC161) TaxID=1328760 RepID=A0A165A5T0_XYLHT|nr:major facilitator superfamily protein [Xylona heveae TC161]KZF19992.1 major facilitator superfamily protein [Xylona heveae TC161]